MISDVIDRFRYRFELWWRERRDDYIGPPGTHLPDLSDYVSAERLAKLNDPKYDILFTESTPRFIIREVSLYVAIMLFLANIGFFIDWKFPRARHVVGVIYLCLVALWTLLSVLMAIDMAKKRKAYRARNAKSSNQPLQLTADRRDDSVSIHEPPYTASFPPFRQR